MPQDNPPRRRPSSGGSRARAGGAARPVDDAAAARTGRGAPPSVPPSFNPGDGRPRPVPGDAAIQIGGASRPAAPPRGPTAESRLGVPARRAAGAAPAAGATPAAEPRRPRPASALPPSRPAATPKAPRRPGSRRRRLTAVAAVLLALLIAWPVGLAYWANGKIQHVDALSGAANTPGTTYLLAGSDARGGADGIGQDGTLGARTDTIMLLQVPQNGPAALISLPRDTFVEVPGHGKNKLNAAYSLGGAPLLVQTVEKLTTMHVDHFVEVGLGGLKDVVNAVGGVSLCLDPAVNKVKFPVFDTDSGLVWDAAGCKTVDGDMSLAFARMRKADLEGDIGRAKRQQQLISALTSTVATPSLSVNPGRQVALLTTGLGALQVSNGTDILDLGRLGLAFRSANGPGGIKGTPPIKSLDYRPGGVGSTVQLDPDKTPAFFQAIMNGTQAPGPVGGAPTS